MLSNANLQLIICSKYNIKTAAVMSRGASKRINSELIQENYINSYIKSASIDHLGMQTMPKSEPYYPQINHVSSLLEAP